MAKFTYDELTVGDSAEVSRTISESDVYMFAGITGDMNPAHVNEVYAEGTAFGKRIAHGILVCGLISNVLGNQLPGNGTIYMSQTVKFLAPVYIGDTLHVEVAFMEKKPIKDGSRSIIMYEFQTFNQDGKPVLEARNT